MRPAKVRKSLRLGTNIAPVLIASAAMTTPLLASPAYASRLVPASLSSSLAGAAPMAIVAGAVGFGVIAAALIERWRRQGRLDKRRADRQLAQMRAKLDEAQAILEGMPEITVRWRDGWEAPQVYGPASALLPKGQTTADVLDFVQWLGERDADALAGHISHLRETGQGFDLSLTSSEKLLVRATGRMLGDAAVVRLRPAFAQPQDEAASAIGAQQADRAGAEAILSVISKPAWVRNKRGELVYGNAAYRQLVRQHADRLDAVSPEGITELFPKKTVRGQLTALESAQGALTVEKALAFDGGYDLVLFPLKDGTAGYLRERQAPKIQPLSGEMAEIGSVINALRLPIAIFDARQHLVQANTAYAKLWGLAPDWLVPGTKEQAILDRLRTLGVLPAEVDYRAWRDDHLKSYRLTKPRESLWHLPDGRALNVSAVPAASSGGVVYVFEDQTETLALESRFNALTRVQNETINALGEGVAVFGTDGRLTLANPRLSKLWKLPLNVLAGRPHIDEITRACADVLPEDGGIIWRNLKPSIVDLNPTRGDVSDRIRRADGRLIDYAAVRLPDGQTMITFMDVTESANYQRVLKERNDALVTADKLKDAFVQNVSYELRSPLTNIIGFADLLTSGAAGELNDKQKRYTDYIKASSTTLGVLIDNILDLANVDAGIAELNPEEQDVDRLVDLARAGLAATFTASGAETPLNLEVDIAPDLPRFVADGTRMVQVLYNLLSNAARFSEAGSLVRLKIVPRGADRILFIVEDEGVGLVDEISAAMEHETAGRGRPEQPVEGRQREAGLGLAIVRTFVNLHGGTVTLEKRAPKGTRVIVNMPSVARTTAPAAEDTE